MWPSQFQRWSLACIRTSSGLLAWAATSRAARSVLLHFLMRILSPRSFPHDSCRKFFRTFLLSAVSWHWNLLRQNRRIVRVSYSPCGKSGKCCGLAPVETQVLTLAHRDVGQSAEIARRRAYSDGESSCFSGAFSPSFGPLACPLPSQQPRGSRGVHFRAHHRRGKS